jgi:hypothetical protein
MSTATHAHWHERKVHDFRHRWTGRLADVMVATAIIFVCVGLYMIGFIVVVH